MNRNIICATLIATALAGCSASPEEMELENVREQISPLESKVSHCRELMRRDDVAAGERSKAEWDRAAATNVDSVSPEQEQQIRASLSAELGIPPSKVDWKGIYKRRAEQAKSPPVAVSGYETECGDQPANMDQLSELRAREERLIAAQYK